MNEISGEDRLERLLTLHGQIFRLLKEIDRLPVEARGVTSRPLAWQYNRLRHQAAMLAGDLDVAMLVPQRAWYVPDGLFAAAIFGTLLIALITTLFLWGLNYSLQDLGMLLLTLVVIWTALLAILVTVTWLNRRNRGLLAATTQEVCERAILLLAYVRENIKEVDPSAEAELPEITIPQVSNGVATAPGQGQTAKTASPPTETSTPDAWRPAKLTESERRHLEIQFQEQQTRYGQLTARITAITGDLG